MTATIKAVVLRTNRTNEVVDLPKNGIGEWQGIVGGYLQAIRVPGGVMYMNEDPQHSNPPVTEVNELATVIALDQGVLVSEPGILGDVIIVGTEDEDGDNTDAPQAIIDSLVG